MASADQRRKPETKKTRPFIINGQLVHLPWDVDSKDDEFESLDECDAMIFNGEDEEEENVVLSNSLEDLVNTFDATISKCFKDLKEKTEKIAPVQIRSEDEFMSTSQVWYTLTGNFGNLPPADWSVSSCPDRSGHAPSMETSGCESWDDGVSMSTVDTVTETDTEPVKSAEEVIREIDQIMENSMDGISTPMDSKMSRSRVELLHFREMYCGEKERWTSNLHLLSCGGLRELLRDMETGISVLSDSLVAELATRDELEFEKEQKEQFVALLMGIQRKKREWFKRRQQGKKSKLSHGSENSRGQSLTSSTTSSVLMCAGGGRKDKCDNMLYLSTVIPYHCGSGSKFSIDELRALNKILRAIFEDSPSVDHLLTDYILRAYAPADIPTAT